MKTFLLLAALASPLAATAADSTEPDLPAPGIADATHWGLGLAFGTRSRPYAGLDRDTSVVPLVFYNNSWLRVAGTGAELKLANVGGFSFGLGARLGFGGYSASDSSALTGMDERKRGFWLGPSVNWRTPIADFSLDALGDVTGASSGVRIHTGAQKTWLFASRWSISPRIGATWLSADYVDYYYGVKDTEATADRPQYSGRATVELDTGVRLGVLLAPHHSMFVDVDGTHYGHGVTDSPIVDKTTQLGGRIGYVYRF
jgi:MipA family protein